MITLLLSRRRAPATPRRIAFPKRESDQRVVVPSLRCSQLVVRKGGSPVTNSVRTEFKAICAGRAVRRAAARETSQQDDAASRPRTSPLFETPVPADAGPSPPAWLSATHATPLCDLPQTRIRVGCRACRHESATVVRQLLLVTVRNGKNRLGRATRVVLVGLHDADHFECLFNMPITSCLLGL
jgi:hypothetical protein